MYDPGGHGVMLSQDEDPRRVLFVPLGHSVHDVAPKSAVYCPMGHRLNVPEPLPAYVPGAV